MEIKEKNKYAIPSKRSIVLTGGGSAGHIMPNIALLPELVKHFSSIYYLGEKDGLEEKTANRYGIPFYGVPAVKFDRKKLLSDIKIPLVLWDARKKAKAVLLHLNPSVVFAKGGYVSLPTVLAAHSLGIPVVIHESDYSLGLANRVCLPICEKLLTSFAETSSKGIYTGNPIREELLLGTKNSFSFFGNNKPCLLFMGGSSGAQAINDILLQTKMYLSDYNIIHLCGKLSQSEKAENYLPLCFYEDMANLYSASDVVITRAGANALCELLALGKRIIAIPLPKGASRGDQLKNADFYLSQGLIDVVPQSELTPKRLIAEINKAIKRPQPQPLCNKAAIKITEEVLSVINQE